MPAGAAACCWTSRQSFASHTRSRREAASWREGGRQGWMEGALLGSARLGLAQLRPPSLLRSCAAIAVPQWRPLVPETLTSPELLLLFLFPLLLLLRDPILEETQVTRAAACTAQTAGEAERCRRTPVLFLPSSFLLSLLPVLVFQSSSAATPAGLPSLGPRCG